MQVISLSSSFTNEHPLPDQDPLTLDLQLTTTVTTRMAITTVSPRGKQTSLNFTPFKSVHFALFIAEESEVKQRQQTTQKVMGSVSQSINQLINQKIISYMCKFISIRTLE